MNNLQRLINLNLKKKLFLNPKALVNQLRSVNHIKHEDGQVKDKVLYENLAKSYDRQNDIITLGHHRYWRRTAVNNITITEKSRILDAPGGTGLITMRLLEKAKNLKVESDSLVTVYDINNAMMNTGKNNLEKLGYNKNLVRWIEGDVQKLPFQEDSFDTYVMFFGIRQNIDTNKVFKEAHRVLKSNGKIVIGEICYSKNPAIMQWICVKFIQHIGSKIIHFIFKTNEAPMYLMNNILNLPSTDETIAMLKNAGFQRVEFKSMSWKIAGIYIGYKI